jgi:DNA-binding CsgD family transcriptional regulator
VVRQSYRARLGTPSPADSRLLDVSVDLNRVGRVTSLRSLDPEVTKGLRVGSSVTALLERLGLSDAHRWIAEHLPAPGEPQTIVVQRGATIHALTIGSLGRKRSRLTVRSIPTKWLPRILEARALALGQARALSSRELEVLRLLVTGQSLRDIAGELGITPRTIKFHQANIQDKLGADSRFDLFRMVFEAAAYMGRENEACSCAIAVAALPGLS